MPHTGHPSSPAFLASGAWPGLTHSPRQLGLGALTTGAWGSFPGVPSAED